MNLAVLAAWLHDIGKFAQRAKNKEYSDLAHEYCPAHNGHSTHLHVLYTDYFIENMPLPEELESNRSYIASLAASHHKAEGKSREHQAIMFADRLSAGMDRTESEEEGNYIQARLSSIFSKVSLGGRGMPANSKPLYYKLSSIYSQDALFPVANANEGKDYENLWAQFTQKLRKLPVQYGAELWRDSLVSLLEEYCWCIPSATWRSLPDVSLYDHSACTAAITQAWLACPEGKEKFLLYGGDLSGIQAFIFGQEEPADKGAARLLRARSFLLQAVTRSVWIALLCRLNLEAAAKIMDAGGRFILLLPDTEKVRLKINQFEKDVEKWLLENFLGTVRLNFTLLALQKSDFEKGKFSSRFDEFNNRLEEAGLHSFNHALKSGFLPVMPIDYAAYAKLGVCEVCHSSPASGQEDGQNICPQCSRLKILGSRLPRARYISFTTLHKSGKDTFSGLLFDNINLHFYESLPPEAEGRHALQILSVKGESVFTCAPIAGHIPVITEEDLKKWQEEGILTESNGENYLFGEPCAAGEPKTFNMLAQESRIPPSEPGDYWRSIACLGVLKADVDNLGMIFSLGFNDKFSLSCFAMLARMLNQFFSGYLMERIRKDYPELYVIFAGGDDIFLLGPWPGTIDFAQFMDRNFTRFCGGNEALTISAGLPLLKPGLPMRAIRETSENDLEKSKNYKPRVTMSKNHEDSYVPGEEAKNAITLFDVSCHWREAEELLKTGKWLATLVEDGKISNAFLRRLLEYSRQCKMFLNGKDLAKNGLYQSHFYYDLARNWHGETSLHTVKQNPEKIADKDLMELCRLAQNEMVFSKMEMGISWAIYRTRKTG